MKKTLSSSLLPIILMSFALAACNGGNGDSSSNSSSSSSDPDATYTVTFDLNYAGAQNAPAAQTIASGGLVTKPADPTRDGHDFTHWTSDIYGSTQWNFTSDIVTADMTLYAGWSVAETPSKLFYVDIPGFWKTDGGVAGFYAWEGAANNTWPGARMTNVSGDIYSYTLPSEYTNFVFVRISPSDPITDWGAKTINLSVDAAGSNDLFTVAETTQWGDPGCQGVWSVYPA
ncbi:MAG: InlB B-repeat-containing protein [Bacilli bacterium]|jgi:uncharacterized repeat protein (TIGR02543 family)